MVFWLLHRLQWPTGKNPNWSVSTTGTLENLQFNADLHPRDRRRGLNFDRYLNSCVSVRSHIHTRTPMCGNNTEEARPKPTLITDKSFHTAPTVDAAAGVFERKFCVSAVVEINLGMHHTQPAGGGRFTYFKSFSKSFRKT